MADNHYLKTCKTWVETCRAKEFQYRCLIDVAKKPNKHEQNWVWAGLAHKRVEVETDWVSALISLLKACKD